MRHVINMNIIICMRADNTCRGGESEAGGRADGPLVLCQNGWISEERIAL